MSQPERIVPRRVRAVRNDSAILAAATRLTAAEGWTGLLFPRVAADAGLSIRPLHKRFDDREDLAAALWRDRLGREVTSALSAVVGSLVVDESTEFIESLLPFTQPSVHLQAASELMIVAATSSKLLDVVRGDLGEQLGIWLTPQPGIVTDADAARRAFTVALALGLTITARRYPQRSVDLSDYAADLHSALHARREPMRLPADVAEHLDRAIDFGTNDPAWEKLLNATLSTVGRVGYDRATVAAICEVAGFTKGLLFRRYSTKRDLFLDATRRMSASAMTANLVFQQRISDTYSPGVAGAVAIREFMRPGREHLRNVFLEQTRLAINDSEIRASIDAEIEPVLSSDILDSGARDLMVHIHTGQALANGVVQLQVLHPAAWDLPYDVVEIALAAGE